MAFTLNCSKEEIIRYSAELMYYIEKHKLMEIISRLLAEISIADVKDPRKWMGNNILRIARDIYSDCLESFYTNSETKFYQLPKSFLHRVVIFGVPGSGRHTQALGLVKRFNLVYIDVDVLVYFKIKDSKQDELSIKLQNALLKDNVYEKSEAIGNIVNERLLMEDALSRGWVLINYPNNSCEARQLFEHFTTPPNRFVFLQCSEQIARQRIITKPFASSPQHNFTFIDRQMQQFRKSATLLNEYLTRRREVVYVDAQPCYEEVKGVVLAEVSRRPYLLGFKY